MSTMKFGEFELPDECPVFFAPVKRWQRRTEAIRGATRHQPAATRPAPERCECCGALRAEKHVGRRQLARDHCHTTGTFRGWLCTQCNSGIGQLGDNIQGLERAIAYLRRFEATQETA